MLASMYGVALCWLWLGIIAGIFLTGCLGHLFDREGSDGWVITAMVLWLLSCCIIQ